MTHHIPDNRRASISTDLIPYIQQKMVEWDVDFSAAINTLLLDHKRARLTIIGGREFTTTSDLPESIDGEGPNKQQDFDSEATISNLVSLLDHKLSFTKQRREG